MQKKISLLEEQIMNAREALASGNAKLASFSSEDIKAVTGPLTAVN